MYISVNKRLFKNGLIYLLAASAAALFGGVYELFSHEVYSYFMIYAFMIPLILGAVPSFIASRLKGGLSLWGVRLYNAGVATLTVGSLFEGVLLIYGTTNRLAAIYLIAGLILIFSGIIGIMLRAISGSSSR